jgi:hypothetical protein
VSDAEKTIRRQLGWWINQEGKLEMTMCGDPYEREASAAEVCAYAMLIQLQEKLDEGQR